MGSGKWSDETLARLFELAGDAPGDVAEIGCWKGDCTRRLSKMARQRGRKMHAFDSFRGCSEPGEHDGPSYWGGKFDIGGPKSFRSKLGAEGERVELHAGFIPVCFDGCDDLTLAVAILDVDMYEPTWVALRWLDPRCYIIAVDDHIPDQKCFAALAIEQWKIGTDREEIDLGNHQTAFVRRS